MSFHFGIAVLECSRMMRTRRRNNPSWLAGALLLLLTACGALPNVQEGATEPGFVVEEATIAEIHSAMGLTSRDGIVPLYLDHDIGGPMACTVADADAGAQLQNLE
jgi:hypothetical protein